MCWCLIETLTLSQKSLQLSSEIFGNLWKFLGNVWKRSSGLWKIFWRIRNFPKVSKNLWKINTSSVKWGLLLGTFNAHVGTQCMFYDKDSKLKIILPLHGNLIQCVHTKMFQYFESSASLQFVKLHAQISKDF